MNPPNRNSQADPTDASADDATIPVLTERLGLPPLDFDTTLPVLDTIASQTDSQISGDLDVPTLPPVEGLPERAPWPDLAPPQEPPLAQAQKPEPEMPAGAAMPTPPQSASDAPQGQDWDWVEHALRASILREIAAQLPQEIETIVQARMNAAIERLLVDLAAETRLALAGSLREIIERAVAAELRRLEARTQGRT